MYIQETYKCPWDKNKRVEFMINGYLTVKEVAKKWGVSPKWVQVLCVEGRIEGAAKLGREWAIPVEAERPEDKRITTGKYKNWRKKPEDR